MYVPFITPLVSMLLLALATLLGDQTATDFTGHWEGAMHAPEMPMPLIFEVDLATNDKGDLAGTLSLPGENITGLPLTKIVVDGKSITFHARSDQPLNGVIAADGKSISGEYRMSGYSVPFAMTRTGDARIEAPARSAPIAKALEGNWNGTLDVNGTHVRLVLTMSNQPDGSSTASIVNLDQGELLIPASAITQTASSVRLDFKSVGLSYAGALNNDSSALAGTLTQGPRTVPLTFRRATQDKQ